jgi:uncharacterized DUF497 family protein
MTVRFEWDKDKDKVNREKHGVGFAEACTAFEDPNRVIVFDTAHSGIEDRWFCYGRIDDRVMTVRFTMRDNVVRIIGAGYWRQWRKFYEEKN